MDLRKFSFEPNHRIIQFEDALHLIGHRHAAHCLIYSFNSSMVFKYSTRASVLMQVRHDGMLGFPGGNIDKELDIMEGLNRELKEEINLDVSKFPVCKKDYVVSHINEKKKLCLHFYKLHVALEDLESIEKRVFDASEFGKETMGLLRVPLYTMDDGFGGFPSFLCNNFIGNARDQLFSTLASSQIMTVEEIYDAVNKWQEIKLSKL